MKLLSTGLTLALWLAGSATLFAQSFTASLMGTIKDNTGSVVPGVAVTATNVATGVTYSSKTDGEGNYTLLQLPPGTYQIRGEIEGFKKFVRDQVVLEVQQTARVDVLLEVGEVSQTVEVIGSAVLLETDTSSLGQVVSNRQVADLPLNGRNPFALAALTPGVVPLGSFGVGLTGGRAAAQAAGANNFMANGGITGANEILLDGIPITVCCQGQPALIPSIDTTEEFKVQTNVSQAEFGRTSGAILNIVTKSGTNSLHGTAYEFLRNEKLDANSFFGNRAGRSPIPGRTDLRPPLRYNQFGFGVGGPLSIPGFYNGRDKTFFFGGSEWIYLRRSQFRTFSVPTQAMRNGDFSEAPFDIYDPLTTVPNPSSPGQFLRSPFPNRRIISARFNPVAVNILKLYPLPTRPGIVNNFDAIATAPDTDRQMNVRIDHNFSQNYRLFGRFSLSDNDHLEPNYWGTIASPAGFNQFVTAKTFVLDQVIVMSPRLITNFRYGLARQTNFRDPFSLGADLEGLGFPRSFTSQVQERFLPRQDITGFNGPDETGNQRFARYTHSVAANATLTRTGHTLKFGWDGRLFRDHNASVQSPSGNFSYGTTFTSGPNPQAQVPSGQTPYLAFASFLLGLPTSGFQTFTDATSQQLYYHGFYLQDDWKVTSKLTLNLGLRFDIETGPSERFNRVASLDPTVSNPLAQQTGLPLKGAVVFAGVNGGSRQRYKTDANNVGPRFGFAYNVTQKTVVRGGFGIFFVPTSQRLFGTGNPGFTISTPFVSTVDSVNPVGSLSSPFPTGLVPPTGSSLGGLTAVGTGVSGLVFDTPLAYMQQWNFNVQRELPGNISVDLAYAGNHGVKLPVNVNLNTLSPTNYGAPGDAGRIAELNRLVPNPFRGLIQTGPLSVPQIQANQLLRAFPHFTAFTLNHVGWGSATYHAFQLTGQKRMSHGLLMLLSYTFSKNIGNVNNLTTSFFEPGTAPGYQNDLNLMAERAVLGTDIPHRLVVSGVYDLPFGKGRRFAANASGIVNQLIGGWQMNGILTFQSGFPLNLSVAGAPPYAGSRPSFVPSQEPVTSGDVHDRLGGVSSPTGYLNPNAFRIPRSFEFGDTSRLNSGIRAPGQQNLDFSVIKNFYFTETARLQFRAEAFNLTNTPSFGSPGTQVGTPGFGVIGAQANQPRQLQLAFKLIW